jgi:hypothetical protein
MAVAEYLGMSESVFSESKPVRNSSDLPNNLEVKTRSKHWHDLIVQKNEKPEKIIVMVTIERDEIMLQGWCRAGEVMRQEFWSDPAVGRPAYFVPKSVLQPVETLKAVI